MLFAFLLPAAWNENVMAGAAAILGCEVNLRLIIAC